MSSYVVVGASRGLGYQWLRELATNKSNTVIGLVRNIPVVQKLLEAEGLQHVKLLYGDMADHISLNTAAAEVSKITGGTLDHLIINGAYQDEETASLKPTEFIGREDILKKDMITSLEVNVLGAIYSINAFIGLVKDGAVKKVIVTSSGLGDPDLASTGDVAQSLTYSTMKAALNMVTAKFAAELRSEKVIFLAISPGVVATKENLDPQKEIPPEVVALFQKFKASYPNWNGPLTPEESVTAMNKVINDLTVEKSGQFLSHWGNKQWL